MNSRQLYTSEYRTPVIFELQEVSPRIERVLDNGELQRVGTVILFACDDNYYVITAAHCIRTESTENGIDHLPYDKIRIRMFTPVEATFKVLEVIDFMPEDECDFALLKVNFIPSPDGKIDYKNDIKIIGSDRIISDKYVSSYGYTDSYEEGCYFESKCHAKLQYKLRESPSAEGKDPYNLKGSSGGGIFIGMENNLYCLGFIKKIISSPAKSDSFEIRHIPQLTVPAPWRRCIDDTGNDELINISSPGNNKAKQEYSNVWRNLVKFLQSKSNNEEEYERLLNEINRKKDSYPRTMSVDLQNSVERLLFYKHASFPGNEKDDTDPNWSENDKRAFAYVMRDKGAWPTLYGRLHESLDDLTSKDYLQNILHRGASISGDGNIENSLPDKQTEDGRYELILRAAFALDFPKMKSLVDEWEPSVTWLPKKVMLDSLWYNLTEKGEVGLSVTPLSKDLEKLKYAIDSNIYSIENNYIACIVYNICKGDYVPTYSYDDFVSAGINSPGDVMAFMAAKIDRKKTEPIPYGIHISKILETPDNDSFAESLRLVNYLMNSGLLTASRYSILVNMGIWMKVFRRLMPAFPGMTIFYSLAYGNEKLSILSGQEIAFLDYDGFKPAREDLLLSIFRAIKDDATPPKFYRGLYLMASEIFPVVDEAIWYEGFYSAVDKTLSVIEVEYLSVRDPIVKFINHGILNLKNNEMKKGMLTLLMNYFDKNPLIISYILSWSMDLDRDFVEDPEVSTILQGIIDCYPLSKTYRIIQALNYNDCISADNRAKIEEKIRQEGLDFARNEPEVLEMLSFLVKDPGNMRILKEAALSSWDGNYWNCGIKGNSFSSRGHMHLEALEDRIEYTDDELKAIMENMKANIRIIKDTPADNIFNSHISHLVADLLLDMKTFIKKTNVRPRVEYDELNQEIDRLVLKIFNTSSIMELLCSAEFNRIREGIRLLHSLIDSDNITKYREEIQLLIHMGVFKIKESMELAIDFISYLVDKYPEEMKSEFGVILRQLLVSGSEIDYQDLHIDFLKVKDNLSAIKEKLMVCEG